MRHNSSAPRAANARGTRPKDRTRSLVQYITARRARPIHAGGQVVGYVQGGVFRKRVRGSRHMLRAPRAWAFGLDSLDEAERLGAGRVEVYDTETAITYQADLDRIRSRGVLIDRGRGPQLALLLKEWRAIREVSRAPGGLVLYWLSNGAEV